MRTGNMRWVAAAWIVVGISAAFAPAQQTAQQTTAPSEAPEGGYEVHDKRRPQPPIVTPPTPSTNDQPGTPPSDAVVLFDGKDLSKWSSVAKPGEPAPWKVVDGTIETVAKSGYIQSNDQFADCQAHVEWFEPTGTPGKSQGRGNSGV